MYTAKVDASVNNIPTSFDATAGSKIIASAPSGGNLTIINTTDSTLYVVWGRYSVGVLPSSTVPGTMISVPGGSNVIGVRSDDKAKITKGDSVYIMTENASARTTGKVWATIL